MTVFFTLEDGYLDTRYTDVVTFRDLQDAVSFAWSHPNWDDVTRIRVDLADAVGTDVAPDEVVVLAYMHIAAVKRHRRIRFVIIVTDPELASLCASYAKVVTDGGYECTLVDTAEAADAYLATADAV